MTDQPTLVQGLIDRVRAGDPIARNDLLAATCERLRRLTRKMLRSYPGVRRWEQTDDVLQNATLRLWKALERMTPDSTRHYFHLAGVQIRRELIDLARHHYGPHGSAAHHASDAGNGPPAHERPDLSSDPARLASWCEFHAQVDALPEEEREVFELIWYQGMTQAEAMQILNMPERTLQRCWRNARLKLYEACQGELPGI
jgi:RNA polymerase sigma factor (sigma-70 family)